MYLPADLLFFTVGSEPREDRSCQGPEFCYLVSSTSALRQRSRDPQKTSVCYSVFKDRGLRNEAAIYSELSGGQEKSCCVATSFAFASLSTAYSLQLDKFAAPARPLHWKTAENSPVVHRSALGVTAKSDADPNDATSIGQRKSSRDFTFLKRAVIPHA